MIHPKLHLIKSGSNRGMASPWIQSVCKLLYNEHKILLEVNINLTYCLTEAFCTHQWLLDSVSACSELMPGLVGLHNCLEDVDDKTTPPSHH